jgi:hypothetical protein
MPCAGMLKNNPGLINWSINWRSHFAMKIKKAAATNSNLADFFRIYAANAIAKIIIEIIKTSRTTGNDKTSAIPVNGLKKSQKFSMKKPPDLSLISIIIGLKAIKNLPLQKNRLKK